MQHSTVSSCTVNPNRTNRTRVRKNQTAAPTEEKTSATPREDDAALGFITSATTARENVSAGSSDFYFPTGDECQRGARAIGEWEWNGREGAVPQVEVYPGLIRLTAPDLNRREKTANRNADRPVAVSGGSVSAEALALMETIGGVVGDGEGGVRQITGWSRKSRSRMVAAMAELDLAPLLMGGDCPAMVTLTYPGEWEVVAPDGEVVKSHLKAFRQRFERSWGRVLIAVWKMEFQRRGAPHFHLLMAPPSGLSRAKEIADHQLSLAEWEAAGRPGRKPYWRKQAGDGLPFHEWLSEVWADIVNHPDADERERHRQAGTGVDYAEGERARDPKRAAVYFGKHGSFAAKDYQHEVPEFWRKSGKSVGRFWGYWGLSKVRGGATLEMDTMLLLGRTLRRYASRTRVWNPVTRSHEFRPVLATRIRPRRRVAADGTIKSMGCDPDTGDLVVDDDGVPVPRVHYRKQTVRAKRMTGPMGAGFLLVNDGPEMARALARVVETCTGDVVQRPVGLRGPISDRVIGK